MKETEVTVEILEDYDIVKSKLLDMGFICTEKFEMIDRYYSLLEITKIKELSFEHIIKNSFLLRKVITKKKDSCNESNLLIYKDKTFNAQGDVIEEEKVHSNVDSVEKHAKIFELAGLKPYATLVSNNDVFKKNNIEFILQNVKNLGLFIEIEELEGMKTLSPEEKSTELIKILKSLNLNLGADFNCKKLNMFIKNM